MAEDTKFAIVSPKSVKLHAESVGVQSLTDNLASTLAEDVTYRLRETLQVQFDMIYLETYASNSPTSRML